MDFCKKKRSVDEEAVAEEFGRKWIRTALDTTTRLIICFLVGNRTFDDARSFLKSLLASAKNTPLFVSDELPHYADGLKELFHTLVGPELSGQRGRPKTTEKIVDSQLDYATVHKIRENGRVVKVEKKVIYGSTERIMTKLEDTPSSAINTAVIERTNLDWRLWDAHLVRKSPTSAKSINWLKAKFIICVAFYDFIRPHESLSRGIDRKFRPKTPAMAAGITNSVWTPKKLLSYRILCQ